MGEYTYTNEDLIKMQSRPFNTKLQVTTAKFLEFCQKTKYNVYAPDTARNRKY